MCVTSSLRYSEVSARFTVPYLQKAERALRLSMVPYVKRTVLQTAWVFSVQIDFTILNNSQNFKGM